MSLVWELFQEYQIGKRKNDNATLEETVSIQDEEIAGLCDIVGEIAKKVDELEAQLAEFKGGV